MPKPTTAKQYGYLQAVAHGKARKKTTLSAAEAREGIMELSPEKRKRFSRASARRRKKRRRRRAR